MAIIKDSVTDKSQNTKVWADGFGVWHASVPLSGSRQRDANLARKMIRDELAERHSPNFDPQVVGVTRVSVTNHGTAVYREVIKSL